MVSTLSSPSAFTPDDHFQVFFEILVDSGSEQVDIEALLSNPGFENLLCSAQFEQLLCRFPPQDLSDCSLEVLIRMITDKTILEDLSDEELIPTFVDLLAKRLVKAVGLEMDNISARSCPLSVTGNHISVLTQPAPHANKIPSYSAEIRSALIPTGSGIYPNSAFSSQQTSRCNIHHTVPSSGMLAPNETLPIYSSIAHGNDPAIRPLSTAVKINYKPNIGAAQHSPKLGFQPNALDGRNYVSGGKCQCGNHERGTHHGSTPYLRRAPHCTIGSTLTASVFIPDHSATLSSLTSYRSPRLIQGSTSLSIEDASDLIPVAELPDTEPSRSAIQSDSVINPHQALQYISNPQRGIHCNRPSYNQHAPHFTLRSTLFPSASIPEQSATPSSPVPCHSPHSIQDSVFLAVENTSDLASPANSKHDRTGQGRVNRSVDREESLSAIDCTETIPCTVATDHLEFPGSYSHGSYPPYNSPVDHVDYARVVSPNHHSCSSTVSSLPVVPLPSQQWHYDNQSSGSAESDTTNVGYTSLSDSESSTAVEELAGEWWDRDWNSDSLFSSDSEDGHPSPNHDIGLYHDEPVDGSHLELGLEQPEGNEPQFGYWNDFSYNSDGAGLQSDDLEDSFDDSPDPEYDEEDNHHLVSPNEVGCDNDLQDGLVRSMNEDNDSFYDRNIEPDHHSDSGASEHPDEQEAFSEDGVDPQFEDDNRVSDNGEVRNHFGDEESLFDDGNSDDFEFDDQASQRSDELEISPDDSTHLELEEPEGDVLFCESGNEYEEYSDDGASQCSDDWGVPPDSNSDQGYESARGNDEFYEDGADQYGYGNEENPDERFALVSQNFPRSLWPLQFSKHLHLNQLRKNGYLGKPLMHHSIDVTLLELISSHITLFVAFAVFETSVRSTISRFVQSRQLSRRFDSSIEGINVASDYRENLLLPIEYSKPDSEFGEEEIEWDVPGAPSPSAYLLLCRTFQSWSSFLLEPPLMYAVVAIRIVHVPVDLGLSHTDQRSPPPPNFAVTYDSQLGDKLGGNGTPLSSRNTSNPLACLEIKLVRVGLIELRRNGQYRAGHIVVPNQILFVTFVVRNLLDKDSGPQMVPDKSLLVLVINQRITLWLDNAPFSGENIPSILYFINVSLSNKHHVAQHLCLPIVDFPQDLGYSSCEKLADSSKEIGYTHTIVHNPVPPVDFGPLTPISYHSGRFIKSSGKRFDELGEIAQALYPKDGESRGQSALQTTRGRHGGGVPISTLISAHPHAHSPPDLAHCCPINPIRWRTRAHDWHRSSQSTLFWTLQVVGNTILLRKSEGLKGGVKTHEPNKPYPHFSFAQPLDGVVSHEPKHDVIHHRSPTYPHPTSPLSSIPSTLPRVQPILAFIDGLVFGQDDSLFELSKDSQETPLHSKGSRTAPSSRIDPHELDFSLVNFIFTPVSHLGFVSHENSPPINILVDRTARNLRGGSPSLLDIPFPSLPSQTSIEYPRLQIDQLCHRSTPHHYIIVQFPPLFARSALDHRDGSLPSDSTTNKPKNLFPSSSTKGDRQLAASRVLKGGSLQSLHPHIDVDVRSSGYLHPNHLHSFLATTPNDQPYVSRTKHLVDYDGKVADSAQEVANVLVHLTYETRNYLHSSITSPSTALRSLAYGRCIAVVVGDTAIDTESMDSTPTVTLRVQNELVEIEDSSRTRHPFYLELCNTPTNLSYPVRVYNPLSALLPYPKPFETFDSETAGITVSGRRFEEDKEAGYNIPTTINPLHPSRLDSRRLVALLTLVLSVSPQARHYPRLKLSKAITITAGGQYNEWRGEVKCNIPEPPNLSSLASYHEDATLATDRSAQRQYFSKPLTTSFGLRIRYVSTPIPSAQSSRGAPKDDCIVLSPLGTIDSCLLMSEFIGARHKLIATVHISLARLGMTNTLPTFAFDSTTMEQQVGHPNSPPPTLLPYRPVHHRDIPQNVYSSCSPSFRPDNVLPPMQSYIDSPLHVSPTLLGAFNMLQTLTFGIELKEQICSNATVIEPNQDERNKENHNGLPHIQQADNPIPPTRQYQTLCKAAGIVFDARQHDPPPTLFLSTTRPCSSRHQTRFGVALEHSSQAVPAIPSKARIQHSPIVDRRNWITNDYKSHLANVQEVRETQSNHSHLSEITFEASSSTMVEVLFNILLGCSDWLAFEQRSGLTLIRGNEPQSRCSLLSTNELSFSARLFTNDASRIVTDSPTPTPVLGLGLQTFALESHHHESTPTLSLLPTTLSYSSCHHSQHLVTSSILVPFAPVFARLYQHLKVVEAITITVNNQHDRQGKEIERDILETPTLSNHPRLNQPVFEKRSFDSFLRCSNEHSRIISIPLSIVPFGSPQPLYAGIIKGVQLLVGLRPHTQRRDDLNPTYSQPRSAEKLDNSQTRYLKTHFAESLSSLLVSSAPLFISNPSRIAVYSPTLSYLFCYNSQHLPTPFTLLLHPPNARSVDSNPHWYPHSHYHDLLDDHQSPSTRECGIDSPRILRLTSTAIERFIFQVPISFMLCSRSTLPTPTYPLLLLSTPPTTLDPLTLHTRPMGPAYYHRFDNLRVTPRPKRLLMNDKAVECSISSHHRPQYGMVGDDVPEQSMVYISSYYLQSLAPSTSPGSRSKVATHFPGAAIEKPPYLLTTVTIQTSQVGRVTFEGTTGRPLHNSIQQSPLINQRLDSLMDSLSASATHSYPFLVPFDHNPPWFNQPLLLPFCLDYIQSPYLSQLSQPHSYTSPYSQTTNKDLEPLMIEARRQEEKAYVMKAHAWCSVATVHFVGSHATSNKMGHSPWLGSLPREFLVDCPDRLCAVSCKLGTQEWKIVRFLDNHETLYGPKSS